ncbi:glycoside hydrolase family 5 protein [Niabella insulamsoli]|uniref:glycoside hydrolase family 5 protein n=1 Tax=Niabella insulamsoli TaxID=3144874 RepID=UPI0031FBBFA0
MKRYCFSLWAMMFLQISATAQPVKQMGQLQVIGTQLSDAHGRPAQLKGMSFGWSCFHPRFYTAGAVRELKEKWHCNVVRAAMGVEPKEGYLDDPERSFRLVKTVVDAAIKNGIYVIVDWHSHNIHTSKARDFFVRIAKAYKNYPNIIYEIFNEPDQETWQEVKGYADTVIAAIRAVDPDNIILVGSPHWDQHLHFAADDPIKGFDNIMYTMHFYAGTHKKELRDRTDEAIEKGLPVFVSESGGMLATGDGPIDQQEWEAYIQWMKQRKLSWLTWSVSDKDETCSVLEKTAGSEGGWKESDIKDSGKMAKAYLKDF